LCRTRAVNVHHGSVGKVTPQPLPWGHGQGGLLPQMSPASKRSGFTLSHTGLPAWGLSSFHPNPQEDFDPPFSAQLRGRPSTIYQHQVTRDSHGLQLRPPLPAFAAHPVDQLHTQDLFKIIM
jgi:hypothetical protein